MLTLNQLIERLQEIRDTGLEGIGDKPVAIRYKVSPRRHDWRLLQYACRGVTVLYDKTEVVELDAADEIKERTY